MSKITVSNIPDFYDYLVSIARLGDVAEFLIDSASTEVRIQNEDLQMKFFLTTKSLTSDDGKKVSFCLKDIQKLLKAVRTISEQFTDVKKLTFNVTSQAIEYKEKIEFKILTVKREVIDRFIAMPVKTELNSVFSFDIDQNTIKKIESLTGIGDEESKLYFYVKDGSVMVEINNRRSSLANSISIPITSKWTGTCASVISCGIPSFRLFNVLGAQTIRLSYTDRSCFKIGSASSGNTSEIISVTLKV